MKEIISILFITGLIVVSCNEEIPPVCLEENFKIGEVYISEYNILEFTVTEITDSRCPSDVVCVWQGEAIVKIEIDTPQKDVIILSTYDNVIDTSGIYSFELIDVTPYPISTQTINLEDYNVTLKIEEL